MRTAVAKTDHGMRMTQHRQRSVVVALHVVGGGRKQQLAAVALEQQVIHQRHGIATQARSSRRDARFGRRLVLRRIAQREYAIEPREDIDDERGNATGQRIERLSQNARPQLRIAHAPHALGERQLRDRQVARLGHEWMQGGLQSQHQTDRPRRHLAMNGQTAAAAPPRPAPKAGAIAAAFPAAAPA